MIWGMRKKAEVCRKEVFSALRTNQPEPHESLLTSVTTQPNLKVETSRDYHAMSNPQNYQNYHPPESTVANSLNPAGLHMHEYST